eukprot:scaffold92778_cov36-Tisochrysis_lutea.AAC.3
MAMFANKAAGIVSVPLSQDAVCSLHLCLHSSEYDPDPSDQQEPSRLGVEASSPAAATTPDTPSPFARAAAWVPRCPITRSHRLLRLPTRLQQLSQLVSSTALSALLRKNHVGKSCDFHFQEAHPVAASPARGLSCKPVWLSLLLSALWCSPSLWCRERLRQRLLQLKRVLTHVSWPAAVPLQKAESQRQGLGRKAQTARRHGSPPPSPTPFFPNKLLLETKVFGTERLWRRLHSGTRTPVLALCCCVARAIYRG